MAQENPPFIEQRPFRWYHALALASLVALPFAQWVLFFNLRTRASFLVPLAIAASIILAVGVARPRYLVTTTVRHSQWILFGGLLLIGLLIALSLPPTGQTIAYRGFLTDSLTLGLVMYLTRIWHSQKLARHPS
jgi:hypothetical protein